MSEERRIVETKRGPFTLRPERPEDDVFLFHLFRANNIDVLHLMGLPEEVVEQLVRFHETVVGKIMRFHERRGRQGAIRLQRDKIEPRARGRVLGQHALGVVPGARGRAVHGRIRIENTAPIAVERVLKFLRR